MSKCLFCYNELENGEQDFHTSCAKKFFGSSVVPSLDYTKDDMDALALSIIKSQTTLTGVQPKLSLHLNTLNGTKKLTIVGLWGDYIFKPQSEHYAQLPEIEDLTMHLAECVKIQTVPHSLIRMKDGALGYITKRIDRDNLGKIAMEDFCQLTERQTEYKYRSSYEQIGKAIDKYSAQPNLDKVNFFEIVLFSFITGNNDMHLKNFSLYSTNEKDFMLAPAYDLLNAAIVNPADKDEMALTVNGKKSRLKRQDFIAFAANLGISNKIAENLMNKMLKVLPKWKTIIEDSFLSEELKLAYIQLIEERIKRFSTSHLKETSASSIC